MRRQCGPRQRLQLRKKTVRQRRWCIALRRRQRSPTATADISRDQLLRLSRLMSCGNQVVVVARSTYASLRCLLLTRTSCCVLPAEQCGRVAAQLVDGFHQLTPANRRGGSSSLLLCCLLIFFGGGVLLSPFYDQRIEHTWIRIFLCVTRPSKYLPRQCVYQFGLQPLIVAVVKKYTAVCVCCYKEYC